MKYFIIAFLFVGCQTTTHKVYLYKQLAKDGLIATFESAYEGNAERNCQLTANLFYEKYQQVLTCSSETY